MNDIQRQIYLQEITRRLVLFTGLTLLLLAGLVYLVVSLQGTENGQRSYQAVMVFAIGVIGGFISLQQRATHIGQYELRALASSWVSITLIPINGGIFAVVLMLMFMGGLLRGDLFPVYPDPQTFQIIDMRSFMEWFRGSYPSTGSDMAKLLFWSFAAGFAERLMPQIVRRRYDEPVESISHESSKSEKEPDNELSSETDSESTNVPRVVKSR